MMCVFSEDSIFFSTTVCLRFLSSFFCCDIAAVKFDNPPKFLLDFFFLIFFGIILAYHLSAMWDSCLVIDSLQNSSMTKIAFKE